MGWLDRALHQRIKKRHPNMNINLSYKEFPYSQTRDNILKTMSNQTPIDLLSVDQIWLGELADKGFLTDLSNRTNKWENLQIGTGELRWRKLYSKNLWNMDLDRH